MTMSDEAMYFPVRGLPGVRDSVAAAYDGRWRVLDSNGRELAAHEPALGDVTLSLRFGYLVLRAPGMLRLDIPLDVLEDDASVIETVQLEGEVRQAVDEGAWAAAWLSEVAGRPLRLVKLLDADIDTPAGR